MTNSHVRSHAVPRPTPSTLTNNISRLITAGSYLAGLGFSIGAIMKFKQHRDNPTQIPIGTPIALTFIAAAILLFPTLMADTENHTF